MTGFLAVLFTGLAFLALPVIPIVVRHLRRGARDGPPNEIP